MPEPRDHSEKRNWIETILRNIPGFRGYLEKEYRRESDDLQRDWLADRLERSKRAIDDVTRALADAARPSGPEAVLAHVDAARELLDGQRGPTRLALHQDRRLFRQRLSGGLLRSAHLA